MCLFHLFQIGCRLPPVGCWRTDEIPVERLRGEGVLIDATFLVSWLDKRDFRLNADDLKSRVEAWESAKGRPIPDGAFIILYTGWGRFWRDEAKYLGNAARNASDLHFPGLHPDAGKMGWMYS